MDHAMVPTEASRPLPVSMFDLGPKAKVDFAASVATVLSDVIEKQHLYETIQGRKYIKVEGWATLGTMLNILPKENKVVELSDGSYEAWVDLISTSNGMVVGGASALCGIDEKRWGGADRYARRSMAITRATGKAYRLAFAFIPAMAGYATTPAEEMPPDKEIWKKEEEFYTGTNPQKIDLVKMFNHAGITDPKYQKQTSDYLIQAKVPMSKLAEALDQYTGLGRE